jgi:hypothetical protein
MRTRERARLASAIAAGAVVSLVAASCGGPGEAAKSASQIFKDAKAATASAPNAHVSGKIAQSSGSALSIDLDVGKSRGGGKVSISGATLQIVLANNVLYYRGDQASLQLLTNNPKAAQKYANQWLKESASTGNLASLAQLANLSVLVNALSSAGTITKGATTRINGQSAIPLVQHSKGGGTLFVASGGPSYIVALTNGTSKSNGTGEIDFTNYGHASIPAPPKGALDDAHLPA